VGGVVMVVDAKKIRAKPNNRMMTGWAIMIMIIHL
jgi:hypothetical protein